MVLVKEVVHVQDVKTHVHGAKKAVVVIVKIHANLDVKIVVKLTAKQTVNQKQKQIENQIILAL